MVAGGQLCPAGTSAPLQRVAPFDYAAVELLEGPFRTARDLNIKYLLELKPDRLLHSYRKSAGLEPRAPIYGGWESRAIAGTALGHYLTALSIQYRSTRDAEFLRRINYIVDELEICQRANDDGYLSGIPEGRRVFAEVSSGTITADQANLNGSWAPWYVIHKTMSGLRDAWQLAGLEKAKPMLIAKADWVERTTRNLTEEQLERMMACEFGGMNEILLDVYGITKNEKHLQTADRFYHNAVLDPLERHLDKLNGLHANTQIPKLIGETRRYALLGEAKDLDLADFFWRTVVHDHCYHMGGHSDGEHFGPPRKLAGRLGTMTAETCNTYHMLKLTRQLFQWQPDSSYFDFYERALYNHIRASQDPRRGMFAYFITLMPGHFRTYSTPENAFWCCVCTGMENHVRYHENIYFRGVGSGEAGQTGEREPAKDAEALYVNLYIPSTVTWKKKALRLTQRTHYPYEDTVSFTVETSMPVSAKLKLRQPEWVVEPLRAELNGSACTMTSSTQDGYWEIAREWKNGDALKVSVPMQLRKEAMPDKRTRIAIFYGPLMLAARMGTEGMEPPIPYADKHKAYLQAKLPAVPVLLAGERPLEEWIETVNAKELQFRTKGVGHPADVELAPFYNRYYERYAAYLDNFTPAEWEERQAAHRAETEAIRELEGRTIDLIRPGESQMELDHNLKSDKSRSGNYENRRWRDATDGGWFSYDMKVDPKSSNSLMCTYWGGDKGARNFVITANEKPIAEVQLNNQKPGEFFREEYPIPPEAFRDNGRVTIRFEGRRGNLAGGVFELRTVRANTDAQ